MKKSPAITHTPGPWTANHGIDGSVVFLEDHGTIASLPLDFKEHKANAALISAAPDLLAALKALVAWEQYMGGWESKEWKVARAAILKAEGRKS